METTSVFCVLITEQESAQRSNTKQISQRHRKQRRASCNFGMNHTAGDAEVKLPGLVAS
jgi:hypothetical protein